METLPESMAAINGGDNSVDGMSEADLIRGYRKEGGVVPFSEPMPWDHPIGGFCGRPWGYERL